jgi:hypothetical protein
MLTQAEKAAAPRRSREPALLGKMLLANLASPTGFRGEGATWDSDQDAIRAPRGGFWLRGSDPRPDSWVLRVEI